MKGTQNFEKIIHDHLLAISKNEKAFEAKFNNPKKNIKDCITYILNTVQKSGFNGFADEEIFGMAIHYYDEDKIDIGKKINAKVIVNHTDSNAKKLSETPKKKIAKQKSTTEPFEQMTLF